MWSASEWACSLPYSMGNTMAGWMKKRERTPAPSPRAEVARVGEGCGGSVDAGKPASPRRVHVKRGRRTCRPTRPHQPRTTGRRRWTTATWSPPYNNCNRPRLTVTVSSSRTQHIQNSRRSTRRLRRRTARPSIWQHKHVHPVENRRENVSISSCSSHTSAQHYQKKNGKAY